MTKLEILEWLVQIAQAACLSQDKGNSIYLERVISKLHEEIYDARGDAA